MAEIHIRQRFNASIEKTFDVVSRHRMLADNLPMLGIDVIKQSPSQSDGLGSIRAIGIGPVKPLKEKVIVFEPPFRLEYKIVGVVAKLIQHHHGILKFSAIEGGTLVEWHIYLEGRPQILNNTLLKILKRSIAMALSKQAKLINK